MGFSLDWSTSTRAPAIMPSRVRWLSLPYMADLLTRKYTSPSEG